MLAHFHGLTGHGNRLDCYVQGQVTEKVQISQANERLAAIFKFTAKVQIPEQATDWIACF